MIQNVTAVFLGAGFGAILRYYLQQYNNQFPYGTLLANLSGTYAFGFLFFYCQELVVNPIWKTVILSGFLGALTTFSTLNFELFQFMLTKQYHAFVLYFFLNSSGGLLAVFLGKKSFDLLRPFITL